MIEVEVEGLRTAGRGRSRSVAVGVAIAVAVLIGGGGFAIGRSAAPTPSASIVAPAAPDRATESDSADVPRPREETSSTQAPSEVAEDVDGVAFDAAAQSAMPSGPGSGQYTAAAWEEPQQELLSERVTAAGVTMRAHVTRYEGEFWPVGGDGWTPAGWCFPSGGLRVSVAAPNSTNVTWAPFYTEPRDSLSVTTFATGYVEGSPMFGVVAQVASDVEAVTFTTAGDVSDTTAPSGGVALLIVPGPIESDFSITITRADGAPDTRNVEQLTEMWADDEYRAACEPPPPALPEAGDQPADVEGARALVLESWRIAHDFAGAELELRESYVDDATGLAEAWDALQNGQYAEAARGAVADVDELVFTSPTEAWFRYDIETSIIDFANRYGIARLGGDGVWRITRQTICQDIALAPGFGCTPSVAALYPPSAVGDPRYDPSAQPDPGAMEIID